MSNLEEVLIISNIVTILIGGAIIITLNQEINRLENPSKIGKILFPHLSYNAWWSLSEKVQYTLEDVNGLTSNQIVNHIKILDEKKGLDSKVEERIKVTLDTMYYSGKLKIKKQGNITLYYK